MQLKKQAKIILTLLIAFLAMSCSVFTSDLKTSENPGDARIITSDIDRFYQAFDLAKKDTTEAEKIFDQYYFKQGSEGLDDLQD